MPEKLTINTALSHDPLPALEQSSLAYLLVDIGEETPFSVPTPTQSASAPGADGSSPLNLSLVLDTSGSMSGAKLQNLKKAVGWVIDHMEAQDTIAVTLFSDEVHLLVASTLLTDPKALHEKVEAVRESGGTAMSKGLAVGLEEAKKGHAPGVVSRIVALTDGQTWGDADECRALAREAGAAGMPVTALGVGAEEDWSIELLDALAAESGGVSDYIAKPEDIVKTFEDMLRTMQATAFRDLRLIFKPTGGVSARAVYRVAPIISKLWPGQEAEEAQEAPAGGTDEAEPQEAPKNNGPTALILPLGEIGAGGNQTLIYELVLPPRRPGQYKLASFLLQYEIAGRVTSKGEAATDLVAALAQGAGRGPGNPRVMNNVERATTFKLQTRALQASMIGDVAGATRNLRAVATRLLNIGETALAEAAESEAARMETQGQMSTAGTKKLAFDTRRLSVSETENTRAATVRLDE